MYSILCHNCHYCMASKAYQVFPTPLYSCRRHFEHVLFLINTECTAYCWDEVRDIERFYSYSRYETMGNWGSKKELQKEQKNGPFSNALPSVCRPLSGQRGVSQCIGFMWSERGTTREDYACAAGFSPTCYGRSLWSVLVCAPRRRASAGLKTFGSNRWRDGLSKVSFNRIADSINGIGYAILSWSFFLPALKS